MASKGLSKLEVLLEQQVRPLRKKSQEYRDLADWIIVCCGENQSAATEVAVAPFDGNVRVHVEINMHKMIIANLGLDVFVEMEPAQALLFAEKEAKRLEDAAENLEQQIAQQVSCDIASAYEIEQ